jgi:Bifunctional DNA primase/polymerase, N-terminal
MGRSVFLRSAHAYVARFGWLVFPIKPGTKEPHGRFVRHGFQDASRDPEQIERWWTAAPDAWIAVAARKSGLVIIDSDDYKPECDIGRLTRELGVLPDTPRALTARGGVHHYFKDCGVQYSTTACPGVDVKSDGYCLLPPSPGYRWDLGAHPLDTPIADLPDAWLSHLTKTGARSATGTSGPVLPSSGLDAIDSWLGRALEFDGLIGDAMHDGRRMVRCPWLHEHSDGRGDGRDSSTVLFPRAAGHTLGSFCCSHAHCDGRSWRDVIQTLSPEAKRAADTAMAGERNRIALETLTRMRKAVGW